MNMISGAGERIAILMTIHLVDKADVSLSKVDMSPEQAVAVLNQLLGNGKGKGKIKLKVRRSWPIDIPISF